MAMTAIKTLKISLEAQRIAHALVVALAVELRAENGRARKGRRRW